MTQPWHLRVESKVVYNLSYSNNGSKAQSMLAWKDESGGGEPIPEQALLLILGGGLIGFAGMRRRRKAG
ncbi:MAG: hypothetical protein DSZ01_06405 [Gammaproteobacteria bacterium]|nr:MAG: hypothetical protein DSZ01_06405 [Gammaproteobacteria bacterium]